MAKTGKISKRCEYFLYRTQVIRALFIRAFLFQPFFVKGQSMEPNFDSGNYLIVDRVSSHFSPFSRGEVVVFHSPIREGDFYIKRIIGLPGERVIVKDGKVRIFNKAHKNGFVLDESKYLGEDSFTPGDVDISLTGDEVFVMGDNRLVSFDSRSWGPLKVKKIVGIVRVRAWPINECSIFRYNF